MTNDELQIDGEDHHGPPDVIGEFDAAAWVRHWRHLTATNPSIPDDDGAMLAWFSAAIMTGFDYARSTAIHRHPAEWTITTCVRCNAREGEAENDTHCRYGNGEPSEYRHVFMPVVVLNRDRYLDALTDLNHTRDDLESTKSALAHALHELEHVEPDEARDVIESINEIRTAFDPHGTNAVFQAWCDNYIRDIEHGKTGDLPDPASFDTTRQEAAKPTVVRDPQNGLLKPVIDYVNKTLAGGRFTLPTETTTPYDQAFDAVHKYGTHLPGCDLARNVSDVCTCGFYQLANSLPDPISTSDQAGD